MNFRKYVACTVFGAATALSSASAAPRAPAVAPHITTVFVILMENHNWTGDGAASIKGNPLAPYINNTLLPMASHAEQYYNPPSNHPSLPNYLWLEAGTNFGVKADGPPSRFPRKTRQHLVTLLQNAGVTWRGYMEGIYGTGCPLNNAGPLDSNGHHLYAVRHDPFVYFNDVTNGRHVHSANCTAHIRPFSELAQDLANGTVAQYNWITPNLCDDMHDSCSGSPIGHGDSWLSKYVPAILNSAVFQAGGALFITWDEAHSGDGPIPMIVVSPFAKGGGYSNTVHYTHGSTLRTMEEIFGVTPLLRNAAYETDLSDLFNQFP